MQTALTSAARGVLDVEECIHDRPVIERLQVPLELPVGRYEVEPQVVSVPFRRGRAGPATEGQEDAARRASSG
jgi:hypothetical protein